MPKFRKRPIVVEAHQFTLETLDEVMDFLGTHGVFHDDAAIYLGSPTLQIFSNDNVEWASLGDWVILGVDDEFSVFPGSEFFNEHEKVPE